MLADLLIQQGETIAAVVSPDEISKRAIFSQLLSAGTDHYRLDSDIEKFSPSSVYLVNGLGMMPRSIFRRQLNQYYLDKGYHFSSLIDESAKVSAYAHIENGVQILAGAIVQAGARIGADTIINSSAIIEHDCDVGENNHIAPRATLCGQVKTAEDVYIGAGATVIQGLAIAKGALVGAGATLTKDLAAYSVVYTARTTVKSIKN